MSLISKIIASNIVVVAAAALFFLNSGTNLTTVAIYGLTALGCLTAISLLISSALADGHEDFSISSTPPPNPNGKKPTTVIGKGIKMGHPDQIVSIEVPDSDRKRHTFIFGTTGVGKTRLAENLIEQDIKKGMSVIYFDPKGDQDIFTKIYEIARKTGRLEELMLVTPIYPEFSAIIDPLAYYYMPDELVGHIVSGIQAGKEPFFRNVAKEITTAVILANIILQKKQGKAPNINIDQVRQSIRRSELERMAGALRKISTTEAEDVAGMLQDIIDSGPDYYNKVSSSLRTCLADLSFGNIGKIIGKADSNKFMKRLEEGKRVILVVHTGTMLTREAAATLGKVMLSMIQSFIGRVYMSKRKTIESGLSIHIDEAQSLLYEGFEELPAKAGSANVMLQLYAQSVNQIYDVVGEMKAKSILDNTNTKIFLRCSDAETSEYVAKHFGTKTKLSGIYGNNTVTTKETEEDVLKIEHVLDLIPREFYMMTYSGRYKGQTSPAWDPETSIEFPDAPAILDKEIIDDPPEPPAANVQPAPDTPQPEQLTETPETSEVAEPSQVPQLAAIEDDAGGYQEEKNDY